MCSTLILGNCASANETESQLTEKSVVVQQHSQSVDSTAVVAAAKACSEYTLSAMLRECEWTFLLFQKEEEAVENSISL